MCGVRVIMADAAGACAGVGRALRLADEALASDGTAWALGPIVHNPRVMEDLESRGLRVAEDPEQAGGATLLLRAHGVTPELEARAQRACARVIDATCPLVRRVHAAAERMVAEGRLVVVVGDAGHAEVEGIVGHAPGALVVGSPDELSAHDLPARVGVVAQTTQSRGVLVGVARAIEARGCDVEVADTICDATSRRQEAALNLAGMSDVMVVVGGRGSANTRRLLQLCSERCPSHMVEGAGELVPSWFDGARTIGLTAGASTPTSHMGEVRLAILDLVGE